MNKKVFEIALLFSAFHLLIISNVFGQSDNPKIKLFTIKDGLPDDFITDIFIDSQDFVWVLSYGNGLSKFDGKSFINYRFNLNNPYSLSSNNVTSILEDKSGNIWVSTDGGGVNKFNRKTERFQRYISQSGDTSKISDNYTYKLFQDKNGCIWLGHYQGLSLYDEQNDSFNYIPTEDFGYFVDIENSNDGYIWITNFQKATLLFDIEHKKIVANQKYPVKFNSIYHGALGKPFVDLAGTLWQVNENNRIDKVSKFNSGYEKSTLILKDTILRSSFVFQDKSENYWLVTENNGLVKFNPENGKLVDSPLEIDLLDGYFIHNVKEDDSGSFWVATNVGLAYIKNNLPIDSSQEKFVLENEFISSIYLDKDNFLWVSGEESGFFKYNLETKEIDLLEEIPKYFNIARKNINIGRITQDQEGNIYFEFKNKIFSWNQNERILKRIKFDFENNIQLFSPRIYCSSGSKIWLSSQSGYLVVKDLKNNKEYQYTSTYNNSELDSLSLGDAYAINSIIEDSNSDIWIASSYAGVSKLNKETNNFEKVSLFEEDEFNPDGDYTLKIHQVENNSIWVSSLIGIFKLDLKTHQSKFYSFEKYKSTAYINNIIGDDIDNLWVTNGHSIFKYDQDVDNFVNYNYEDGLYYDGYYDNGAIYANNGRIYIRGKAGLLSLDTKRLNHNPRIPNIVLTGIKKYIATIGFEEIKGVNEINELVLNYDERDFSISYSALDYTNPSKNEYAYKLDGYSKDWFQVGNNQEVTFTNLPPGNYLFKVKGSNNSGVWNEEGKSLKIKILAPWWLSKLAYLVYSIIGISLVYLFFLAQKRHREAKRLYKIDQLKTNMLTQISHEFRTPLSIIIGLNEELKLYFKDEMQNTFQDINRNAELLLRFINQLLELKKIEAGKPIIDNINGNIVPFFKYLCNSFESFAKSKGITIHLILTENQVIMDYDPEKLQTIISNLISNAIKWTLPGGNIYVQARSINNKMFEFSIKDTGIGIANDRLPDIFKLFYHSKIKIKNDSNRGIGVGLALTKQLVKLLGGSINVQSKLNQGSTFTVTLPITQNGRNDNPRNHTNNILEFSSENLNEKRPITILKENRNTVYLDRPDVLIVEDNDSLLMYLHSILENDWNVLVADNGDLAIKIATNKVPDIILCDLVTPIKDGFEVIKTLKKDDRTSHIPIIVLSAIEDDFSRLKCFSLGAEAYLIKPVKKMELTLRLKKLVDIRNTINESIRNKEDGYSKLIRIADREFLSKIEKLVLGKDYNTEYTIEELCQDLAMSRSQLHNKLKALTGMSTSIFIRIIRLRKASRLLRTTHDPISEIAHKVGFKDQSYFTRCFSSEYGLSPKKLREDISSKK